ncbi:hypothetical protein F4778DRAFT_716080 [Xylariomycetidae sp. FL2044]|nr:hypothetical protein F4778DRAFT_716080 [Xylariomycetidae sp. FL2044]
MSSPWCRGPRTSDGKSARHDRRMDETVKLGRKDWLAAGLGILILLSLLLEYPSVHQVVIRLVSRTGSYLAPGSSSRFRRDMPPTFGKESGCQRRVGSKYLGRLLVVLVMAGFLVFA